MLCFGWKAVKGDVGEVVFVVRIANVVSIARAFRASLTRQGGQ